VIFVKQYGERRTCTNLAKYFVEQNTVGVEVLASVLGWKHGFHSGKIDWSGETWGEEYGRPLKDQVKNLLEIKEAYTAGELRYLVCVKDPYSWCLSFARYQRKINPVGYVRPAYLKNIIGVWNKKYLNWEKLLNSVELSFLFRYEDFLREPRSVRERLLKSLCLPGSQKSSLSFPQKFSRGGQRLNKKNAFSSTAFDRDYYLNRRYMKFYNSDHKGIFRKCLDIALAKRLGYTLCE